MEASDDLNSDSLRFFLLKDGHGITTGQVKFKDEVYAKLRDDYFSHLASGKPIGGAYEAMRSPGTGGQWVATVVVLDFRSVVAFGGF